MATACCALIVWLSAAGWLWRGRRESAGAAKCLPPRQPTQKAEPLLAPPHLTAKPPTVAAAPEAVPVEPHAVPPEPAAVPPEPAAVPPEPVSALPPPAYLPPATVEAIQKEELQLAARLIKDFPQSSDAVALMAVVQKSHGNAAEAVKYWERALKLNPRRLDAYRSLGMISVLQGQYEEAVVLLRRALEIDPTAPNIRDLLARALMHLGKLKEAIAVLQEGIQLGRGTGRDYCRLGQACLQLKQYDKARENYQAAVEIQPDLAEAYYGLTTVCARLGEREASERYREKFRKLKARQLQLRTDPDAAPDDVILARQGLARTLTTAGQICLAQGYPRRAEEHWHKAAILDPRDPTCRMELARLYRELNWRTEALRWYTEVGEIEPENATVQLYIGVLHAQADRFQAAEEAFQKARRLAPQRAEVYWALARLYITTNRKLAEAQTLAETAVQLQPTAPNYHILSLACEKNGNHAGAVSAAKRAAELDPENAKYGRTYQRLQQRK